MHQVVFLILTINKVVESDKANQSLYKRNILATYKPQLSRINESVM